MTTKTRSGMGIVILAGLLGLLFLVVGGFSWLLNARDKVLPTSASLYHSEHQRILTDQDLNYSHRIRPLEMPVTAFFWERSWLATRVDIEETGGDEVKQVERTRHTSTSIETNEKRIRREGLTPSFELDGKPVVIREQEEIEEKIRWTTTPQRIEAVRRELARVTESGRDKNPRWPDKPPHAEDTGLTPEEKYEVVLDLGDHVANVELEQEAWQALNLGNPVTVLGDGQGTQWQSIDAGIPYAEIDLPADLESIIAENTNTPYPRIPVSVAGNLVTVGLEDGLVLVLDSTAEGGQPLSTAVRVPSPLKESVQQVALSRDGKVLAAASDNYLCLWRREGQGRAALLWGWGGPPGGKSDFRWHWNAPVSWMPMQISPDGRWLARAVPGAVVLIDIEEGKAMRLLERGREGFATSFAFHPEEPLLAVGWTDGFVVVWNYESGERTARVDLWWSLLRSGRLGKWAKLVIPGVLRGDKMMPRVFWEAGTLSAGFDGNLLKLDIQPGYITRPPSGSL